MLSGSGSGEEYCDEVIITEDHGQIGDAIARVEPAAIFGTQMERHVKTAKYTPLWRLHRSHPELSIGYKPSSAKAPIKGRWYNSSLWNGSTTCREI